MRRPPRGVYAPPVSTSSPPPLSAVRRRVAEWFRTHQQLVDIVLALAMWVLFALSVLVLAVEVDPGAGPLQHPALVAVVASVQTLALAWRRSRPDLSFALVLLGHVGQLVVTDSPLPSNVTALMSAYAVARYSPRPQVRRVALGAAVLGGVLATLDWDGYNDTAASAQMMSSLFLGGLAVVSWLGGDLTRKRREVVARLQEQNEVLRRERDQRARLAAQDERTRIAREMHDIVAHSLSVVVVQADGAAYAATHGTDFGREDAGRALTTIGSTAREALAETRRLVGVLRTEDEGGDPAGLEYTPTESLGDLPELVDRVATSGIDVTLETSSDLGDVPRETGLAAYRIVQESLTNVIKHAGPGARVTVRVTTGDDELAVRVRDDGRGAAAPDDGQGHGLIGMRERAMSVDGTVTTSPAPGGGYLVTAALPLRPHQEST